ncbi:ryncolin-4-like [Crassostrea virginica]
MLKLLVITAVFWCVNAKGIRLHLSDEMKSMLSKSNWNHRKTDISIHGPMTLDLHSNFRLKDGELFLKSRFHAANYKDCSTILKHRPLSRDGVYTIYPDLKTKKTVICDMTTDGGGWTVIQRRQNEDINFYRNWKDYKNGFGNADDGYWLGNDAIHALTKDGKQMLRVDLQKFSREKAHATYSSFFVDNEANKYRLKLGNFNGTKGLGDSLAHSNGAYFSTMDSDNDNAKGNCAESYKAAWWSNKCLDSNLNGLIAKGKNGEPKYLTWYHWGNKWQSLKSAAMMVRPKTGA